MSFTINHVSLVGGNLVRDAELKYIGTGETAKAIFDIAMNRKYKKKSTDELVEEVSYFRCILWGKAAESLAAYLKKGSQVAIEGRLDQRRWQDDAGATKSIVEIVVSTLVLMGKPSGNGSGNTNQAPPAPPAAQTNQGTPPPAQQSFPAGNEFNNDEVPF